MSWDLVQQWSSRISVSSTTSTVSNAACVKRQFPTEISMELMFACGTAVSTVTTASPTKRASSSHVCDWLIYNFLRDGNRRWSVECENASSPAIERTAATAEKKNFFLFYQMIFYRDLLVECWRSFGFGRFASLKSSLSGVFFSKAKKSEKLSSLDDYRSQRRIFYASDKKIYIGCCACSKTTSILFRCCCGNGKQKFSSSIDDKW